MELDPMETAKAEGGGNGDAGSGPGTLTACVAVTVALLATFLGVCKVKDDNIVQAMQQAQADKLDHWNFYQARNIREEIANATLAELRLAVQDIPEARRAPYQEAMTKYEQLAKDQTEKKEGLRKQAEEDQENYDRLNYRDDQFDLADALVAIAISLLAITALTRHWWLYWVALVPTVAGVFMGLAGLLAWHVHPSALSQLLS
jgi:hypothetical protein